MSTLVSRAGSHVHMPMVSFINNSLSGTEVTFCCWSPPESGQSSLACSTPRGSCVRPDVWVWHCCSGGPVRSTDSPRLPIVLLLTIHGTNHRPIKATRFQGSFADAFPDELSHQVECADPTKAKGTPRMTRSPPLSDSSRPDV